MLHLAPTDLDIVCSHLLCQLCHIPMTLSLSLSFFLFLCVMDGEWYCFSHLGLLILNIVFRSVVILWPVILCYLSGLLFPCDTDVYFFYYYYYSPLVLSLAIDLAFRDSSQQLGKKTIIHLFCCLVSPSYCALRCLWI